MLEWYFAARSPGLLLIKICWETRDWILKQNSDLSEEIEIIIYSFAELLQAPNYFKWLFKTYIKNVVL